MVEEYLNDDPDFREIEKYFRGKLDECVEEGYGGSTLAIKGAVVLGKILEESPSEYQEKYECDLQKILDEYKKRFPRKKYTKISLPLD